jgi:MazG family protein
MTDSTELKRLIDIVKKLRDPQGGCPWDLAQTHDSIKRNLVEESAEFLDAVEDRDLPEMREELGDLLLQVLLHSQIAQDNGEFTLEDVCREEADKLVRRHPHVFGDQHTTDPDEALRFWNAAKRAEPGAQAQRKSVMDGVPRSMPALARCQKALSKAGSKGFEWPDIQYVLDKTQEEFAEVKEALAKGNRAHLKEELGDLLFIVANLCRWLNFEAEEVAHAAAKKFIHRFQTMEAVAEQQGKSLDEATLDDWLAWWKEAKENE